MLKIGRYERSLINEPDLLNQLKRKALQYILVQGMSSMTSEQIRKYKPRDTSDFVPFGDCIIENDQRSGPHEQFYKASQGSCHILTPGRSPFCW